MFSLYFHIACVVSVILDIQAFDKSNVRSTAIMLEGTSRIRLRTYFQVDVISFLVCVKFDPVKLVINFKFSCTRTEIY